MGATSTQNVAELALKIKTAPLQEIPALIERYADDPRLGVQRACATAAKRLAAYEAERERTMKLYEEQCTFGGSGVVIGIDEVGRGAVAGPLTVAAVALSDEPIIGLDDSKRLKPGRREDLARIIRGSALAIGIAHIAPEDIDACGMGASLRAAMLRALEDTGLVPDAVLIDGNPMHLHPKERCIVKGDGRIACIAAASIVAKVTRDALMVFAEDDYPGYGFAASKGYASPEHIAAIKDKGLSPYHRATFCSAFLHEQGRLPLG